MCGLGEGANPPGPHALTPEREGACSPEMEQTRLEPWVGGARANGADKRKAADARDVAPAVTIDDTKRGSSVDTQASRRPLEYP